MKYALKRGEQNHPGGRDILARAASSAYNGGPGQTARYRNPKTASAHKKVDAAFWKKYQAVKQGRELQVAQCLGADATVIKATSAKQPAAKKIRSDTTRPQSKVADNKSGKAWVLAQNRQHYTLQLAVFGSYKAAQKFAADNSLKGKVVIAPLGKDKQGQFMVLNGSKFPCEVFNFPSRKVRNHIARSVSEP